MSGRGAWTLWALAALAGCDYAPVTRPEANKIAASYTTALIQRSLDQEIESADLKRRVEMLELDNRQYAKALDELYSRTGAGPSPEVMRGK